MEERRQRELLEQQQVERARMQLQQRKEAEVSVIPLDSLILHIKMQHQIPPP